MNARNTIPLHREPTVPKPPRLATPARQALHLLISVAGWVVFLYWWWIVLRQVSRQTVEITVLFLLVSLMVVIGVTFLWAWHNRRLYERKGARTHVREVPELYTRDVMGRAVRFEGSRERIQGEPEIEVAFDDGTKTYRSMQSGASA